MLGILISLGILGLIWLLAYVCLITSYAKHRYPGETIRHRFNRFGGISAGQYIGDRCRASGLCFVPGLSERSTCKAAKHYAFYELDCKHVLYVKTAQAFQLGESVWCPKHRLFGPAEQHVVTALDRGQLDYRYSGFAEVF